MCSNVTSRGMRAWFRTVLKVLALLAHTAVVAADALSSGPGDDLGYQISLSCVGNSRVKGPGVSLELGTLGVTKAIILPISHLIKQGELKRCGRCW